MKNKVEEYIKQEIERINRIENITPIDLGMRFAYENVLKMIWKED